MTRAQRVVGWLWDNAALVWLLAATVVIVVVIVRTVDLGHQNRHLINEDRARIADITALRHQHLAELRGTAYTLCHSIDKLKLQLVQLLEGNLAALPRISYYQQHPQDLQLALAGLRTEIKVLEPVPGQCTRITHVNQGGKG